MTILRTTWNLTAGMLRRIIDPPKPGILVAYPSIWKTRIGMIDTDLNFHLNNASYFTQMELAIWYAVG